MSGGLPRGAVLWGAARFVPRDERVVRALRPSVWFVVLHAAGVLGLCVVLIGLGVMWSEMGPGERGIGVVLARVGVVGVGVYLAAGALRWWSRLYVITGRRVVIVAGPLSQAAADLGLDRVQHVTVTRSLVERVLGLGTVGIATAGSNGPAIRMLMVRGASEIVELIRGVRMSGEGVGGAVGADRGTGRGVVVLGLAGGIGAGKSEVARLLGEMGCLVVDSDVEARAAMESPEVRRTLVGWWGEGVIGGDGRIDRKRIAEIVFKDEGERARLEGLVHPLVRSRRADLIGRAREAGRRAVVLDAPLLFEAGVDSECDAVIWVEASRATRLARVAKNRGWSEHELERREKAQWPIERKRAKCRYEILNDSDGDLRSAVESVLSRALSGFGGASGGSGGGVGG
ncbi:MAG: dephospho-CoA kinase [Phycisphaeraceae bacterium]|nr:dephospho-CoA kinase [Phycisphaeraceae bacterium]